MLAIDALLGIDGTSEFIPFPALAAQDQEFALWWTVCAGLWGCGGGGGRAAGAAEGWGWHVGLLFVWCVRLGEVDRLEICRIRKKWNSGKL